ncbi:MAG: hypothetical protein ACI4UE_06045 [Candidatus Scatovivens sp.]
MNCYGYTDGVYGVKTGFTCNAGRCLVSSCKRGDLDIIIVVLGAGTKKQRTVDSINLINYTYKNFEMYDFRKIIDKTFSSFLNNYSKNIKINKSNSIPEFVLSKNSIYSFPIKKIYSEKVNCSIYSLRVLEAPITRETKIGVLQVAVNNNLILSIDILLSNDLKKSSINEYFIQILKQISLGYK